MNKLLDTARILKGVGDDVVKRKLMEGAPDSFLALLEASDRMQARAAAAPMQPPIPQMANQPPVTQGIFPMMAQAAQQLQMQRAMAPQAGLGAVEPPIRMASGGVVALQEGGRPEDSDVEQQASDREAILDIVRKLKAAGKDIGTLPIRGVLGALESGITRPLRAMGVPIPYLPKSAYGGDVESLTPYMDALRREMSSEMGPPRPAGLMGPERGYAVPPAPPTPGRGPGARPPTGIASALRTPPGAVAMTTPEMGPPRPDAGIAGVMPSGFEEQVRGYHKEAMPEVASVEDTYERGLQLRRKYGLDAPNQYAIEQMQREIAQQQEEAKTIGQRALHAAAVGGIGQPTLAGALGAMARTGYSYEEQARNASQEAIRSRQRAIALARDAEVAQREGRLKDAEKLREESLKAQQQAKVKLAEALSTRAQEESKIAAENARSLEFRRSQERIAELDRASREKISSQQIAGGIRQAEITSGQRLSAQQMSRRMQAEAEQRRALRASPESFGKSEEQIAAEARAAVFAREPSLYPELQQEGGGQGVDFSKLPGFKGTYNKETKGLQ